MKPISIPKPAIIREGRIMQQGAVSYCPELLLELLAQIFPNCYKFYLFYLFQDKGQDQDQGQGSMYIEGFAPRELERGTTYGSVSRGKIEEIFDKTPELKVKQVLFKMRQ